MGEYSNPAWAAFLSSFNGEREWAQVLISRTGPRFELRHIADRSANNLQKINLSQLRELSLLTEVGQFRPLKSAPDLRRGWIWSSETQEEVWRALQELYPGSVPDWHASLQPSPAVTDYRAFTNRQTGMYRISQLNSDSQAAHVISACCAPQFCLKRRLWTVEGLPIDPVENKSAIPCLEPCAILLELARKTARIEQEEKSPVDLSCSDRESFLSAIRQVLANPLPSIRTGDLASPLNPRRLQLLLEKFGKSVKPSTSTEE